MGYQCHSLVQHSPAADDDLHDLVSRLGRCCEVPVHDADPPGQSRGLHSKLADLLRFQRQSTSLLSTGRIQQPFGVAIQYWASWRRLTSKTSRPWDSSTSIQCGRFQVHQRIENWEAITFRMPTYHLKEDPGHDKDALVLGRTRSATELKIGFLSRGIFLQIGMTTLTPRSPE